MNGPAARAGGAGFATVGDALAAATDAIRAAGVESPRLDAELLLGEATGLGRAALVVEAGRRLNGAESRSFGSMVRRRVAREPVAYILGRKGFRGIELRVDGRVLIPRPESELLVEVAVAAGPAAVLDVGTGSGALALAIADEVPEAGVVAVDTSIAALDLARTNAMELGLGDRVRFELGEWPGAEPEGGFDLVVANLPYVPEGDRSSLAPEILRYEPGMALFAGADGLDAIRGLLVRLTPKGHGGGGHPAGAVALEVGIGQAEPASELVAAAGFAEVEVLADLAGIPRVVTGRR